MEPGLQSGITTPVFIVVNHGIQVILTPNDIDHFLASRNGSIQQIPCSQQTFDYVMSGITPIIQNAQWQTNQAQNMTAALTKVVTDVLTKYQNEMMLNATQNTSTRKKKV